MTCFKTKRVVAGFVLSILCFVSAPALAKKKSVTAESSKEICQCTCSRDGAITRAWTADPATAPERSLAQLQAATPVKTSLTATTATSSVTTGSSTPAAGSPASATPATPSVSPKTTPETTTVDFSTLQKKPADPQTQVKSEPTTSAPTPVPTTQTTQTKEKAKETPASTPKSTAKTSKTKAKAETPPAPVEPAIVPPQVGDTERDIRKRLGNPAIETTTDNNERLWIYTAPQTVNGVSCQVIKLKLVFKGMRLKDWIEPAQPQYIGNCPAK